MIATLIVLLTSPWYFQIWGLRDKVWWTTVGGPGRRPCRGRPQGRARGSRWGPGPATSSPPPATGATGAGTGTEAAPDTGEWDRQWGQLNKQDVNGPGGLSVHSLHNSCPLFRSRDGDSLPDSDNWATSTDNNWTDYDQDVYTVRSPQKTNRYSRDDVNL